MLETYSLDVVSFHWYKDDLDIRKSLVLPCVDRLEHELGIGNEKNASVGSDFIESLFHSLPPRYL
jgi:hypothetical protein